MHDHGVEAIFFAHEDDMLKLFFDTVQDIESKSPSSKPPILLLVTDYLDTTIEEWKSFKYPDRVFIATGFPLFSIEHPLINVFNATRRGWSWPHVSYAMLEGFLYARFFLGGLFSFYFSCVITNFEIHLNIAI